MGNEFCCPTLVGRTSAWCLVETSCFCEAIVNRRSRSVLRWQFAPRLHRHDEKPQHSPLANLFELTHEPVLCNGCSSEGIYNSVAQRWRCRRVGFSELLDISCHKSDAFIYVGYGFIGSKFLWHFIVRIPG